MKLPAMPFYIGDWRKDIGVQLLDWEESGIYHEILYQMWESPQRGFWILPNGSPVPQRLMVSMFVHKTQAKTAERVFDVIQKLIDVGCLRKYTPREPENAENGLLKTKDLTIHNLEITPLLFNSRMIRDEKIRKTHAKSGRSGGNPNFRSGKPNPYYRKQRDLADDNQIDNQTHYQTDNQVDNQIYNQDDNQKITLSFSVSEREKESLRDEKKSGLIHADFLDAEPDYTKPISEIVDATSRPLTDLPDIADEEIFSGSRNGHKRASRMSKDWNPSKSVEDFCFLECPDLDFANELSNFRDHWVAKPGKAGLKLDWDATLRNWLRRAQGWKDDRKHSPLAKLQLRANLDAETDTPDGNETTIFDDLD